MGSFILLSPWLSFISRTCVKKIALSLNDDYDLLPIPYHFFECKELVKIRLEHFVLKPPPHFKGFVNLRSLKLVRIKCKPAVFGSLIASCPRLTLLDLESCIDLDHVVIDVPSLESLVIKGVFNYLSFKNVARLANISLCIEKYKNPKAVELDSFKDLATSCELQHLHFGGRFSWFLAAGGVAESFPLAFNHLNKVSFTDLDLGRVEVYDFVFRMVQSCPSIKELEISVTPDRNAVQQKLDYDDNYKLGHLLKVKITGITGSQAELIFVEYLLAISVVLEKLFFECGFGYRPDANSELQLLRDLLQLPRTSPKAQLVWLKK
ncbi:hypothetical protein SOVF_175700 [Spinacia oleracea]|nr:hypothetical protein SOVF_175700 [Spinacia oleracea]